MHPALTTNDSAARPLWCVSPSDWSQLSATLTSAQAAFAAANGFEAKAGQFLVMPTAAGGVAGALFGLGDVEARDADPLLAGKLPSLLPAGAWTFAAPPPRPDLATLAFALGSYRFERYRKVASPGPVLVVPPGVDPDEVSRLATALTLARDLINTPANDLGPDELEQAVRDVASGHAASVTVVRGEALAADFPLIHAVGKSSPRAPRLIDLTWGDPAHPKVTLVGKGVCFDTGGLDIKPSASMLLMKKDMGGAATALGLAALVMQRALPVRLRLLVPAVENAVSGRAFRPSDVYRSRKGLSVEIGNTDAEGRLILADALALADAEAPDLLIDLATLTGAARVALGPDLPPFFTDDDALAADIARHAEAVADPLWRLPLWRPYASGLDSKIADLNNVAAGGFAGAITAALFLSRFVEKAARWVHLDIYGWTPKPKPGRPEGGEGQAIRALDALLVERYGRTGPR